MLICVNVSQKLYCFVICTRDSDCNNHGNCLYYFCSCDKGYAGAKCQVVESELPSEITLHTLNIDVYPAIASLLCVLVHYLRKMQHIMLFGY